jgi:hypothetical protein
MLMGIVLLAIGAASAQARGDEAPQPAAIEAPQPAGPALGCPRVEIRATGQEGQARGAFSAATAGDLEFRLQFTDRHSGRRAARAVLRVYTPKGHLYQELSVRLPASRPGRREVSARLPVSGTLIVNSSLYGRWRLETHLDDSLRPCGPPRLFTITP